jgi:signal transduction histidine kinase
MINELYNSTKINAGHFELEKTKFDFAGMISEAVDTVKMLHPDYSIDVANSAGLVITADRYRLIQVVTNYLGNSIKYADGKKNIRILVTIQNEFVEVAVKDNGMGIAGAHLPFIFDRFFRAEKTMNLEGIGLGLFLCKQIIHAHNGHVWAESEEGEGSTFYFSIPLRQ